MDYPQGPCDWPLSFADCQSTQVFDDLGVDDKGLVESMAVNLLWRWTGRQFGLCEHTIRPNRKKSSAFMSNMALRNIIPGSTWQPYLLNGEWYNTSCGSVNCGRICRCCHRNTLTLPAGTTAVTAVHIDGELIDPAEYRIEWQYDAPPLLIRRDGHWPMHQNLSAELGEENTWSVTIKRGKAVPPGGQVSAGILAVELAKALCKDNSCQLPARVKTVTRQGVTVDILDTMEDIDEGKTGIYLIDSWVASVTRPKVRSARVYSPDVQSTRVSGWSRP